MLTKKHEDAVSGQSGQQKNRQGANAGLAKQKKMELTWTQADIPLWSLRCLL